MHIFKSNVSILFVIHLNVIKAFLRSSLKGDKGLGRRPRASRLYFSLLEGTEYLSALSQNIGHFDDS